MAVEPLFVSDMDTLKAALRLSSAAQPDALSQIDRAVERVRVDMFDSARGLGQARVTELLAIPYVENATDSTSLSRTRANNLEISWTRLYLLKTMPTLFMDASSVTLEAWNEEPLTRKSDREICKEIELLEKEIIDELGFLQELSEEDLGRVNVTVFCAESPPARPGASIFPSYIRKNNAG